MCFSSSLASKLHTTGFHRGLDGFWCVTEVRCIYCY